MKMLDHDVLATVVAVAETGNMTRAAEAVNRSQSAVSMQIKSLEDAIGRPLFVRKPRSIVLTREGEVLLGFARRMLALRDEAWAAVVRPEVTGKVVIGVPDDYASSLLPSVLKKFSATYPKVEIQVMGLPSSALAPLIKDGTVDLVRHPHQGVVRRLHPPRADGVGRDDERAARVGRAAAADRGVHAGQRRARERDPQPRTREGAVPHLL